MKFCLSTDLLMESTSKQLVLKNISKNFGELVAVKDVDLVIEPAEFICFRLFFPQEERLSGWAGDARGRCWIRARSQRTSQGRQK